MMIILSIAINQHTRIYGNMQQRQQSFSINYAAASAHTNYILIACACTYSHFGNKKRAHEPMVILIEYQQQYAEKMFFFLSFLLPSHSSTTAMYHDDDQKREKLSPFATHTHQNE